MITNIKTMAKTLLAVYPRKSNEKKKRKKNRMAVPKLFALNVNAITTPF